MRVGIMGVAGYTGVELTRILLQHPEAEIVSVTGKSTIGKKLEEIYPHITGLDITITETLTESVDIVYSALPHGSSAANLSPYISEGIKVIDLSADFRLHDVQVYEQWYQTHGHPKHVEKAIYGLPEIHHEDIYSTKLTANPGCYPTSAILALAPAIKAGIVQNDIIIDSKSGTSGAGRKAQQALLHSEINENLMAYSLEGHRHMPEVAQELSEISTTGQVQITFVPHLVPMTRGIMSTCYANLKDRTGDLVPEIYEDFYKDASFTHVVTTPPMTKHTLGNNNCLVYPTVDFRTNKLVVISCIDNLLKGASGQAVQNMNIMFGLPENMGLKQLALYP